MKFCSFYSIVFTAQLKQFRIRLTNTLYFLVETCFCLAFVRASLLMPFGHLLGKG